MKQNSLLPIVVVVVLAIIAYLVFGRGDTTPTAVSPSEAVQTEESEVETGMSMRDLVAKGESVQCTFNQVTDVNQSSGTVYIADGKVRGNFDVNATQSGETFGAYMITDGEMSYVWSSDLPQGFKVPLADAETSVSTEAADSIDYNQKLDYECQPWTADQTFFTPPTSVTFVDVTAMQGAQ